MVVLRGAAGSRDFDLRAEAVPIALRANKRMSSQWFGSGERL